ncbi:Crossover junction endonuclease mus81 [Mortierella sp. GBA30]|nr:Crossover junction endonuclease mus81 [Mortierella sp. GBA30]
MPAFKKRRPSKIGNKDVDGGGDDGEPKLKKARQKKSDKQYIPTYRSGPYAILLTLLEAKTSKGEECLTKHQITTRGQVHCDASLTNAEHGKFYTAWSSMKTLLGKNLVYQAGTKYYLTDEGVDIAEHMKTAGPQVDPTLAPSSDQEEPVEATHTRTPPRAPRQSDAMSDKPRKAMRSDSVGMSVHQRSKKATAPSTHSFPTAHSTPYDHTADIFDNSNHDAQLYRQETQSSSATRTPVLIPRATLSAASTSRTTPSISTPTLPLSAGTHVSRSGKGGKDEPVSILSDSEDDVGAHSHRSAPYSSAAEVQRSYSSTIAGSSSSSRTQSSISTPSSDIERLSSLNRTEATLQLPAGDVPHRTLSTISRVSAGSSSSRITGSGAASSSGPKHDPFLHLQFTSTARSPSINESVASSIEELARFQPIVFLPGTFDICLVLDIREVRTQTDRDYIGEKLKDRGIHVIKRALNVGDMIWIARLKDPSPSGPDEIVLDYIVERKRMDDLVGSIKDGRFNEQKFRLRRSGLGNVIYLVETYKQGETYDIGPDAIRTAMMKTQVQDAFFLKRTDHTDQTIDYLVSITNAMKKLYESEKLYAIPDKTVKRTTYLELQEHLKETFPDRTYLTSYKSFGSLNAKSDLVTVKDTFVKMLMSIRGASSEKAMEIARVYGTPRAMFSALDGAGASKRKKVLAHAGSNVGRKKVGPALSAKIAELWYADEYP